MYSEMNEVIEGVLELGEIVLAGIFEKRKFKFPMALFEIPVEMREPKCPVRIEGQAANGSVEAFASASSGLDRTPAHQLTAGSLTVAGRPCGGPVGISTRPAGSAATSGVITDAVRMHILCIMGKTGSTVSSHKADHLLGPAALSGPNINYNLAADHLGLPGRIRHYAGVPCTALSRSSSSSPIFRRVQHSP